MSGIVKENLTILKPRKFLRCFLYSYIVTSAQLLGDKAPTLRRWVVKNTVKALLQEYPEIKDVDPVDLVKSIGEGLLGADIEVEEVEDGVLVKVENCRICPRDLVEAFVEEHPNLEHAIYDYNICAFATMIEEILKELEVEHHPIVRGRCRMIIKKEDEG